MFVVRPLSWFKMFINEIYLTQCLWHIIDIIIVSPIIWLSYMHKSIISPKKSLQSLQIKIKVNFSRQWSYAYSMKLTHFIFKSIINVHSVSFFVHDQLVKLDSIYGWDINCAYDGECYFSHHLQYVVEYLILSIVKVKTYSWPMMFD